MNQQDRLWKAILEEFFYEFLEFHYPNFVEKIDRSRNFEFLDKDLPNIIPEAAAIGRKADKVVKVHLKDGTEQWIVVHIEVQGYKDPDFAKRMFIYYYRLWEKFGKPIASLVIYSDKNNQNRVSKYEVACLNTSLIYNFDTYVIADYTVEEYDRMNSPIAIVYQVGLMGLQKKLADEELLTMKVQLFRKMYEKGYGKEQIRRLTTFIKEYVHFAKDEFLRKFDEETIFVVNKEKNMGIIETVKLIEREKGIEKGMERGMEKGAILMEFLTKFESKIESIQNLIRVNMPIEDIANAFEYDKLFVQNLSTIFEQHKISVFSKRIATLRKKIKKDYDLPELKTDLAVILLEYKFLEKPISETLKLSPKKVKQIKTNLTKK